jgi:hypothetical protein
MRSTHESGLTEHSGHSSVYGVDKLWIRMPSITCQAKILIGSAFRGWADVRCLIDVGRPRLAVRPGRVHMTG